ncbi:hypothetical protein [Cupriavidus pauculus]|uniref:Uncharacterized protein n=1 Tax=Cupriavidus pauculus TaxID=82633 RepID=A0A2N5C3W5_9BURK|nr:hypothetical protein [Cupriavidus pauculus]PLP96919.1 hypothetical protein CYJ10_29185 [Cupriavidus pauculus]
MAYAIGQIVRLTKDIIEDACGEHPALLLGTKGDLCKIAIRGVSKPAFAFAVDRLKGGSFAVKEDEIQDAPANIWLFSNDDDYWLTRETDPAKVLAEYLECFGPMDPSEIGCTTPKGKPADVPCMLSADRLALCTFTNEDGTKEPFAVATAKQVAMPDTVLPYLFASANF